MKLSYYLLFLITLFSTDSQSAGFLPNEIVHLSDSIDQIQNLNVGAETVSFDGINLVSDKVTQNAIKSYDSAVKISFQEATLTVTPDQLLFLFESKNWVSAKNLKPGDLVLSISGKSIPVLKLEELKKVLVFHDLTIQNQHNFFVTKLGILVHNDPVVAYFGTLAACKAAEAAACVFSAAAAGWLGYLGYEELSKRNSRSSNSPYPTFTDYSSQQEKAQRRLMEQVEKQRNEDRKKAKREAEAAFKKAQQNKKEPVRQITTSNTRGGGQSNKTTSVNLLAKEVSASPLQKDKAAEKISDPLGINKSEEAKETEKNPLGVKDKAAGSEKPVTEEEAKKADESEKKEGKVVVSKEPSEKKLTDKEIEKALEEIRGKANAGEKKSAQISENPTGNISEDFDSIPFDAGVIEKETSKGKVRVGEFSNGYKVIERHSTEGRRTIELQRPDGRATDKIRYGSK